MAILPPLALLPAPHASKAEWGPDLEWTPQSNAARRVQLGTGAQQERLRISNSPKSVAQLLHTALQGLRPGKLPRQAVTSSHLRRLAALQLPVQKGTGV